MRAFVAVRKYVIQASLYSFIVDFKNTMLSPICRYPFFTLLIDSTDLSRKHLYLSQCFNFPIEIIAFINNYNADST